MRIDMMPVVKARELELAVMEKYEIEDFEIRTLFWEGDFMNDCYKNLYFADDEEISYECDGVIYEVDKDEKKEIELRNKIYKFLRKMFPTYESILVDVSW